MKPFAKKISSPVLFFSHLAVINNLFDFSQERYSMSSAALLRAVISIHPAGGDEDLNIRPSMANPVATHRNKLRGKMRNTLQQRTSHEPQARPSSDLFVNGERTSPRSISVPLLQRPAAPSPSIGSPSKIISRTCAPSLSRSPPRSPKRTGTPFADDFSEDERYQALQVKQFLKKSILRTRRVRHPVVTDTPRGAAVQNEHPVLPLMRRHNDVLGSSPFSETHDDIDDDEAQLPKLSVTGGIRRLVPRLSRIPNLYSEFPR